MHNFLPMITASVCLAFLSSPTVAMRFSFNGTQSADGGSGAGVDWSHLLKPAPFQGGVCNSCYAWAAIGVIEARAAIASGSSSVVPLSVQQSLDCVRAGHMTDIGKRRISYNSVRGCGTGFPTPVLQYAIDEGFMSADDYSVKYDPDAGGSFKRDKDGFECLVDTDKLTTHPADAKLKVISRKTKISRGFTTEEDALAQWVERVKKALETGPVAIGIDKSSYSIGNAPAIREGSIATKDCPMGHNNDHAVMIVGWGEDAGKPYWNIQNSWSEAWGNGGYFKIPQGQNFCGAETSASYLEFA